MADADLDGCVRLYDWRRALSISSIANAPVRSSRHCALLSVTLNVGLLSLSSANACSVYTIGVPGAGGVPAAAMGEAGAAAADAGATAASTPAAPMGVAANAAGMAGAGAGVAGAGA